MVEDWMASIAQQASPDVCCVLIGTKTDLDGSQRAVSTEEGQAMADQFGMPFFETSAIQGTNVDAAFQLLAEQAYERFNVPGEEEIISEAKVDLNSEGPNATAKGGSGLARRYESCSSCGT